MAITRKLMSYIFELSTGISREEFLVKYHDPVLVQAYTQRRTDQSSSALTRVMRFSSSAIIDPDDTNVSCIGHYGSHEFAGTLIIGGSDENLDVVISGPNVAKRHVQFILKTGLTAIVDGSKSGVFVNGNRVTRAKTRVIESGCAISFGPVAKYEYYSTEGFWEYVEIRARMLSQQIRDQH